MRLVLAHDSRLEMLQEVSMGYFEANDIAFPVRVLCVAFLWHKVCDCALFAEAHVGNTAPWQVALRVYTPIYSESTVMYFLWEGCIQSWHARLVQLDYHVKRSSLWQGSLVCFDAWWLCAARGHDNDWCVEASPRPQSTLLWSHDPAGLCICSCSWAPPHAGGVQAGGSAVGKINVL